MKVRFKLLMSTLLLASSTLIADVIEIPVGQQSAVDISLPQRGQTMTQVEQLHGAPQQRSTTGHPPITRWNYGNFSVYFEGRHVLHSASHFTPAHPVQSQ